MTNANVKLENPTEVVIKLVEISNYRPLSAGNQGGKKFIAGRGEAAIMNRMAEKKGVSLERSIKPAQLVENFFSDGKAVVTLQGATKNVEAPTHVAFVPVFEGFDEGQREYSADMHMQNIQAVMKQALDMVLEGTEGVKVRPQDVTLRMTYPGTYEGLEASQGRKDDMEQALKNLGVQVQWQLAGADLPEDDRPNRYQNTAPVNYGEFAGQAGDVMVSGSRDLRTARVTEALKTVGKLLIQGQQAKRLIVPLTIGANLTMAEAAIETGVPVVLAYIGSNPEEWVATNRERVNALVMAGAQIVGAQNVEWAQGLFSASIEDMAKRVTEGGGRVALMTPENNQGEGKRLAEMPGVKNFFPQVREYLDKKLGEGTVDGELAQSKGKREEVVAQQDLQAAIDTADIPF